jgi:hypothetical protein
MPPEAGIRLRANDCLFRGPTLEIGMIHVAFEALLVVSPRIARAKRIPGQRGIVGVCVRLGLNEESGGGREGQPTTPICMGVRLTASIDAFLWPLPECPLSRKSVQVETIARVGSEIRTRAVRVGDCRPRPSNTPPTATGDERRTPPAERAAPLQASRLYSIGTSHM